MDVYTHHARSPGLLRRLAALFYDLVLLFGVLMIAIALVIVPYDLVAGAPFPHDERSHRIGLQLYLVAVIGLFFVFFGFATAKRSV